MALRRILTLVLLALLAFGAPLSSAQDAPLNVVATYSILGDLVANVGGDQIALTVLVGADSDSHVYEPTPQDAIALARADVIFENGLEFETWLDALYESSGSSAARVAVSEGIEAIPFGGHEHDEHEGDHDHDEHEHDHEHGEFDPHVWHDPNNAVVMVENIRDALMAADPANAAVYAANAEAYIVELLALDAYIREQVAAIPAENRVLVTSHESFGYFAAAYGFEVLSVTGGTTNVADPSAGALAELITAVRESGARAVFVENVTNPAVLERIAAEAGVTVADTLYTDALGQPGTPGETYLSMMRYNVDTIVEALR
jgi:zinc/manganese transport system substrate-binding protein